MIIIDHVGKMLRKMLASIKYYFIIYNNCLKVKFFMKNVNMLGFSQSKYPLYTILVAKNEILVLWNCSVVVVPSGFMSSASIYPLGKVFISFFCILLKFVK